MPAIETRESAGAHDHVDARSHRDSVNSNSSTAIATINNQPGSRSRLPVFVQVLQ